MKKKIITLSILILSSVLSIQATDYLKITPASPQAQDFMKYIDYPVNYTSGLPEVNIPLYTINSSRISVPISLSYHASGFKPNEVNSIVGQGWTLNAGNRISRSINAAPDEICLTNIPKDAITDFPFRCDAAGGPGEGCIAVNTDPETVYLKEQSGELRGVNTADMEYDIFYYSHLGRSGKFIFERNTADAFKPVVLPYAPVVINTTSSTNSKLNRKQIDRFQILDENGTLYNYGKSISTNKIACEEIETYDDYSSISRGTGRTSWLLTEIISADKSDTIFYEYNNAEWKTEHNIPYTKTLTRIVPIPQGTSPSNPDATWMYTARIHKYSEMHLSKIRFKGGEVRFSYYTTHAKRKLDYITVYDAFNKKFLQTIKLNLSTFGTGNHWHWHHLNSIEFKNKSNSTVQKYDFAYYTPTSSPGYPTMKLPLNGGNTYSTCAIDHWGYYNGAPNESLLGKAHPNDTFANLAGFRSLFGDANRNPNPEYAKIGVLKTITYPTGGTTTFEYEGNQSGYGISVGGLRLKKMIKKSDNNSSYRTYKYGEAVSVVGEPSMFLYGMDGFKSGSYYITPPVTGYFINSYTANYSISPSPQINFNLNSQPITYLRVKEFMGNETNHSGAIEHLFDKSALMTVNDIANDYFPTADLLGKTVWYGLAHSVSLSWAHHIYYQKAYRFGETLEKQTVFYNANNEACKKIIRDYSTTVKHSYKGLLVKRLLTDMERWISKNYYFWKRNYKIEQLSQQLTSETTYEYPANGDAPIPIKKVYTYNDRNQIISEEIRESGIGNLLVKYEYPTNSSYPEMFSKNILTPVIRKSTYKGDALINKEETSYTKWHNLFYAPLSIRVWKKGKYQLDQTPMMETRTRITHYDTFGNPLTIIKDNNETTSYLWGYLGKHLVAEFKGADYEKVKWAMFGTPLETQSALAKPFMLGINSLRSRLPDVLITTYTYNPLFGNIESTVAPNGEINSFYYDDFGRLSHKSDHSGIITESYNYNYKNK